MLTGVNGGLWKRWQKKRRALWLSPETVCGSLDAKTHGKVYVYEWKHNSVTGENKSKTPLWAEIVGFVNGYFYMRKSDNRLTFPVISHFLEIKVAHPTEEIYDHCLEMELEFLDVGFTEERKPEIKDINPWRKARKRTRPAYEAKNSTRLRGRLRACVKPQTHWWEASSLTTALTLLTRQLTSLVRLASSKKPSC